MWGPNPCCSQRPCSGTSSSCMLEASWFTRPLCGWEKPLLPAHPTYFNLHPGHIKLAPLVSHSVSSCFSCSPQTHIRLNSGHTTTSTALLRSRAAPPPARLPCCTSTKVCHLQATATTWGHLFVQGMSRQRSRDRMHGPQAALLVALPRLNLTVHHRTHLRRAMPPNIVLHAKLNYHERALSPMPPSTIGWLHECWQGGGGMEGGLLVLGTREGKGKLCLVFGN
jgi:hypothetical protein